MKKLTAVVLALLIALAAFAALAEESEPDLLARIREPERPVKNISIPPYMVYRDSVMTR